MIFPVHFLKRMLGRVYERLTAVERKRLATEFELRQTWPGAVLFYHRVANNRMNPWSISTRGFEAHLEWLSKQVELVSLHDLWRSQCKGSRTSVQTAITFDDGYHETVEHAVPKLIDRRIPATFFICTQFIQTGSPFPHDSKRNQVLPPMTFRDLRFLVEHNFEIGGHTHSHLDLGKAWDSKTLRFEIHDSRKRLQDWTGQEVRAFAFPYGMPSNMSQAAIDAVADAGYSMFLSAYGAWNLLPGDSFHLKRIHGDEGLFSLRNWLTLDPRKFRKVDPFYYSCPPRPLHSATEPDTEKILPIIISGFPSSLDSPQLAGRKS